ncbi:uncharacterized protein LOC111244018 isoform X1 [Varroa destructor]|uniref:Chitin-binding type-2 domain-containing protein n=2 Tax=Varroa destructor TaxID=109461 RepID=A0A7M7J3B9_VARDE|nr:uncharacterized protein LOC111244018 isoform X1 [Varroa destructor]
MSNQATMRGVNTLAFLVLLGLVFTCCINLSLQQRGGGRRQPGSRQPESASKPPSSPKGSVSSSGGNNDDDDDGGADIEEFECPRPDGLFADPENCRRFYICAGNHPYSNACPPSLYFDDVRKFCTFKDSELKCGPIEESETEAPDDDKENKAAKCDTAKCVLPDCFCSPDGTLIPGGLEPKETPQMVVMSFDGALNGMNYAQYKSLLTKDNRKNPNGCPIHGTFFLSHEYTSYFYVQKMYADGHEMGSLSVSHRQPETFWQSASFANWTEEIGGQREIIAKFGNITKDSILGFRAPFIKPGGNNMMNMAYENGFAYDSSYAVPQSHIPTWPYTLDHLPPHRCLNGRCATKAFPGLWEMPLNTLHTEEGVGGHCVLADQCVFPSDDSEEIFEFLKENFLRHYTSNRAPLGLFFHVNWFTDKTKVKALGKFVDYVIDNHNDAYFVTMQQALLWMRTPKKVTELRDFAPWQCEKRTPACNIATTCAVPFEARRGELRYMETCTACPVKYPWLGNYEGSHEGRNLVDILEEQKEKDNDEDANVRRK